MRRTLGKTDLQISPLGIGGGQGISSENLMYAFERGINYFFFSSDLHHFSYQNSVQALQTLCKSGSAVRDKVVLATVSYLNDPAKIHSVLFDQLAELGVEYIDVFHWGWITGKSDCQDLFKAARQVKEDPTISQSYRQIFQQQAQEINQDLVKRGLVRYVGASFHDRHTARRWMSELDVLMLRYNIAHTGIERDILPYLQQDKSCNPGIVAFNVGHEGYRHFNVAPPGYPPENYVPTIPDCYRFALTNPAVDLVLAGLNSREQIDQALAALEKGPLTQNEYSFMRYYGALNRPNRQPVSNSRQVS